MWRVILEGQVGEVYVAAGEDDTELWCSTVRAGGEIQGGDCAGFQKGRDCYCGRWFDDETMPALDGRDVALIV